MDDTRAAPIVSEATIRAVCGDVSIPPMGIIEQVWTTDPLCGEAVTDAAVDAVDGLALDAVPRGGTIAVGVGSRGIANIDRIVAAVIATLQSEGYEPFIFPAMGSHGGASAEGQAAMLAEYGITEATMGCPITATMDTVEIGRGNTHEVPVVTDAAAAAADGICVINRIKPHTSFAGDVESGLAKMLVIGMGKQRGAKLAHQYALDWSFREMLPEITAVILAELPVVGGIAIVEDQHDGTARIEGVPPSSLLSREAELLDVAYELLPQLPFDTLDVVIFDRMGKDISGAGLDTNVTGRNYAVNEPSPPDPTIRRIYARSLTPGSHGNAAGLGQADLIHADLYRAMDIDETVVNLVTSGTVENARIPITVETDWAAIAACISTVGVRTPETIRVLRATDTMQLGRVYASPGLCAAARDREDLRVIRDPAPMRFEAGQLIDPPPVADGAAHR
jgi:hypothetical protein